MIDPDRIIKCFDDNVVDFLQQYRHRVIVPECPYSLEGAEIDKLEDVFGPLTPYAHIGKFAASPRWTYIAETSDTAKGSVLLVVFFQNEEDATLCKIMFG